MKLLPLVIIAFILSHFPLAAQQVDCEPLFESRNGWYLPTEGQLRILIVFCEINYSNPADDPTEGGNESWPAGKLPVWANDLVNPHLPDDFSEAKGLTQYFLQASSGRLIILGDYLRNPEGGIFSTDKFSINDLIDNINEKLNGRIITNAGLNDIRHFDNWTLSTPETGPGLPKQSPSTESPSKYDHVMFIWRNRKGADNTGASYSNGFGRKLLGFEANTYSINTTYRHLPFKLIRHEFSHLILGGNNFHCGGGGHAAPGYFPHLMGGWSILGLHDSSIQTWNAWDRQRLGWKCIGSPHEISARDENNKAYVNADLDANNSLHEGVYILRDFATYGEALRIRMPHLDPEEQFQQFLWLEFHQGAAINSIPYYQWQYESEDRPCVLPFIPGMFAYMQIDRENRKACNAGDVFSGFADYLRPVPANGFWDRLVMNDEVMNDCVQYSDVKPFKLLKNNPFSGSSDLDRLMYDMNNDAELDFNEVSSLFNYVEFVNGDYRRNLFALGHPRHAFHKDANKEISIDGNPSSANMMNMVRSGPSPMKNQKNVRKVYINGIHVSIIDQQSDFLKVKVSFKDYNIKKNVRWCADEIVLQPYHNVDSVKLILNKNRQLHIDRSLSASRMNKPEAIGKKRLFNDATTFLLKKGASIEMKSRSRLIIDNGSTLKLDEGAFISMSKGARIIVRSNSSLEISSIKNIQYNSKKLPIKIARNSRLIIRDRP
jgi:hypothetical protein